MWRNPFFGFRLYFVEPLGEKETASALFLGAVSSVVTMAFFIRLTGATL